MKEIIKIMKQKEQPVVSRDRYPCIKIIWIILVFLAGKTGLLAQPPAGWQHLDLKNDKVFGISSDKAWSKLIKKKKMATVVAAVIDSGIDTAHEDLRPVLWSNPGEQPGNGADDDHNGYVDDVHGWSFIGSSKGNVQYDNLELVRLLRKDKDFYDSLSKTTIPERYEDGYKSYQEMEKVYEQKFTQAESMTKGITNFKNILDGIVSKLKKDNPSLEDFKNYEPQGKGEEYICKTVISNLEHQPDFRKFIEQQIQEPLDHFKAQVDYQLNMSYDPRYLVGDDYSNTSQKNYGCNDVTGPDALHGTHVAGIIGAVRDNNTGIRGIAGNVRIMSVRTVPDGDERDKDVANAIRYAADNGAKVINMSFGKGYSWNKKVVDDAVKYAISKDVLLVHAAGNDGEDLDKNNNFPSPVYEDGSGKAGAWIEVGASGWKDSSDLVATFSNFGKNSVDVFAPGVDIYSTTPGNEYKRENGTSMAAPVVAALAALIRSRYPKLSALQVKEAITESVTKSGWLKDKCVSGGVVNAYNALEAAKHEKKKRH